MKPNLGYRSVKLDGGWRKSWDAILSGRFSESPGDALLFYDAAGGTGEFYTLDGAGNLVLLETNTGWRNSWSQIVPGSYAFGQFTGLLFYERAAGHGEFYSTDGLGNLALQQAHDGWRTSWDQVVPIADESGLTRLLFYDRGSGHGEIYAADGQGDIVLQQSFAGWRTTWSNIRPLQIGSGTYLLFYEASSGHAELYAVDATGTIQLRRGYSGWRTSWSNILPVDLQSSAYAGLVFYDRGVGESELYTIDAAGELAHVRSFFGWRRSWALMTEGSFGGVFDDLLLYDRDGGEGELLALDPWPRGPLEGYVSRESVRPGEPISVHVRSSVGPFRVQILRRGLSDSVVSNVGVFPDQPVDLPIDGPENGCTWPAATDVTVPTGSPSGLYVVRLSTLDGGVTAEVPFIVLAEAPGDRTAVLFAIPSSTYEAYCWWGGRSLYGSGTIGGKNWSGERAFRVSPRRPYLGPDYPALTITPKFQYWELPFIRWLERNGIVVDYCTSNELHSDPELLAHYQLVVTVGHDEYWSWEMRDNVEQFAANGGTVAVLSGNSVWWQIRFEDEQAVTCFKDRELDPAHSGDQAMRSRVTVLWIDQELDRPETLMTGVSFQYGTMFHGDGVTSAPVFEVMTQHPVLQDTSLELGDTFGMYADNVGGRPSWKDGWFTVVGYETDARPTPGSGAELEEGEADPRDPDWRSNWDSIIPADLSVGNRPDVLFYDKGLGEGELHRAEPSGTLTLRRFYQGWRSSWDKIIAGDFGSTGSAALLFYDRSAGVGEFYAIEADGGIALLRTHDGWRPSWDQIVQGNFGGSGDSDLLFYDRGAGVGEFYATDGSGNIALLRTHDGWRQSWDMIVAGNFGGSAFTDLLFYDRAGGVGEFYAVSGGEIAFLNTETGWRSSWDMILPLRVGGGPSALLFYDRAAGTGEIYATNGAGSISLLRTYLDWRTTWESIVPLRLDGSNRTYVLFNEADTGYAELYFVDQTGTVTFVHSYTDPTFTLIARSRFPQPVEGKLVGPTREFASMGMLRIGNGRVFSASTTDWSFGLSQSPRRWSAIDQITANLLHLYGSCPRLTRPLLPVGPPVDPEPISPERRRQLDALRSRPASIEHPGNA